MKGYIKGLILIFTFSPLSKYNIEFRKFISEIYFETYSIKEFSNVNVFIDINGEIGL